jgi:hypothetical protein
LTFILFEYQRVGPFKERKNVQLVSFKYVWKSPELMRKE